MAVAAAQLRAVVNVSGADDAKNKLGDVGKSADTVQQGFGQMLKQGLANAAGFAVFNVGAKAVNFLKDQFSDTLQVAMQHQEIMSQTAQVIKSTGDASGMTAQQIGDLAMSLSKVTPFSDDTIQSGENLLLTFKGIGQDVFPQVTQTMLDMAQAMGTDTKSAALQLGKALDDPAKGMTALSREGVTFSDKQKEAIKQMVAMGDTAGAQKLMLKELQSEFGGSAKAAGQTFGGQLQILQNNLEDTKQKIGTALLPILGGLVTNISQYVLPAIQKFGDFLQSPAFQKFASDVGQKVMGAFQSIGNVLKSIDWGSFVNDFKTLASDLAPIVANLKPVASTIFNVVGNVLKTVVKDVGDFAKHLGDVIKFISTHQTALDAFKAVLITIGIMVAAVLVPAFILWAASMIPVVIETLLIAAPYILIGAIIAAIVFGIIEAIQHWGDIVKWLTGVWSAVAGFFEWLWGQISGFFVGVGKWFADRFTEAYNGVTGAFGAVGKWFQDLWQGIVNDFNSILGGLGKLAGNIWNGITDAVKSGFNFIIDLINNVIKTVDSIHVGGFGINIPLIPHLAMGGLIAQAGMALVGERGPELVQLPAGARVIPNSQIGSAGSSGQVIENHIHVYLDGKDITNNVMTRAVKSTRTSGPIRSNV